MAEAVKTSRLQDKLVEIMGKLSCNRYITAIRDAFASTVPITIGAALFLLINNVILSDTGLAPNLPFGDLLRELCTQGYNGTLGMLGIMLTFLLGMRLAKNLGGDGELEAIVALACYVILLPNTVAVTTVAGDAVETTGVLTQTFTSSSTMLLGIISAIVSVVLMRAFSSMERLKISMPDTVPPAVARAFNKLIPAVLVFIIFGIVEVAVSNLSGMSVPDAVALVLQQPLVGGFQSLPGILLYVFLATFVFVFGIHGAFVFGAISSPILLASLQENIDAINAGLVAPNVVTQPFLDCYVYMGGGGTMLCLVIALLVFSRRKDERLIAKIGSVPGLFNISEPIMFGLPVVFNPVYAIPFCIVPLVSTTIAYAATAFGLVAPTYLTIPWVTPPVLSGFLATGGDIRASILQVVILLVGIALYAPFVIVSNRIAAKEVAAEVE